MGEARNILAREAAELQFLRDNPDRKVRGSVWLATEQDRILIVVFVVAPLTTPMAEVLYSVSTDGRIAHKVEPKESEPYGYFLESSG